MTITYKLYVHIKQNFQNISLNYRGKCITNRKIENIYRNLLHSNQFSDTTLYKYR